VTPTLLHAANPGPFTGEGNWTYLIRGPQPVLIDAGVGHAAHLDAIEQAAPGGPARVLVTHAHSDHANGAPAIHARWPSAQFFKMPWLERDKKNGVPWRTIGPGDRVPTGEGDLEAIHTPGHSPDHLAFWHEASRSVFVGDLLVAGTTVFIPASDGGSLADYLRSLHRLLELKPQRAWPAHGPVIDDPAALIHHYLDHRDERERQVLAALQSGSATVEQITAAIYTRLNSALAPMARESVLAHLRKLEDDGRARHDGPRWTVTP
jgi:glyoxylase-like metal-dependent hydrolase (beta-lactamase superfamily II)